MVGTSSMKWFPESYEKKFLEVDKLVLAAKKSVKSE
jgi:predicted GNAT superfamily acetyltransferase